LANNTALLTGVLASGELLLSKECGGYFAAVSSDNSVLGDFEEIYENEGYVLYRVPLQRR
jgi:hypothetical protein